MAIHKGPSRYLELALLVGVVIGAGTTYALSPLLANAFSPSNGSGNQFAPSTVTTTVTTTESSTVTVPSTVFSTSTTILTTVSRQSAKTATESATSTETVTQRVTTTVTHQTTVTRSIRSSSVSTSIVVIPLGASTNSSLGYTPQTLVLVVGVNNTIQWNNNDNATHSIIFDSQAAHDVDWLLPGQAYIYTFTQPGTLQYYCLYHAWMRGTIIVKT